MIGMGKHLLENIKYSWLLMVVLIFVFMTAGEAWAKPNWVGVKFTGWSVRVQKGQKITSGNYLHLVLKFDIKNNSKSGDIITAIYNRKISWKGNATIPALVYRQRSGYSVEESTTIENVSLKNLHYSMTGAKPYKGEWYPGQVYKYEHTIPLSKIIKPVGSWKNTNTGWRKKGAKFAMKEYSLDFQVRTKK
jgi:hypothetical protein